MPRTAVRFVSVLIVIVATGCWAVVPATPSPPGSPSASAPASAQPTMPVDFPVMPGATLVEGPGSDPAVIATWTTEAQGPRVYDFCVAALPTAGFSIVGLYPGGSAAIIRFRRAGQPILKLAITASQSGASVQIQLRLDAP